MRGFSHNLPSTPQGPGVVQDLEGWEAAPLGSANDTLQTTPVLDSGGSVPDGDGGGEDGLDDGGVEVHHHRLWQVEFLQLPQEVHPLMCFFDQGFDVQIPFEVLGDDGTQEAVGLHRVDWGATQDDGRVGLGSP